MNLSIFSVELHISLLSHLGSTVRTGQTQSGTLGRHGDGIVTSVVWYAVLSVSLSLVCSSSFASTHHISAAMLRHLELLRSPKLKDLMMMHPNCSNESGTFQLVKKFDENVTYIVLL